jgi:ribonuclease R
VSPEQVVAHLASLRQPASIREIAHGMELKHGGRRYLPRIMKKLKQRGDIEETFGGRYRLAGTKQAQTQRAARSDGAPASEAGSARPGAAAPATQFNAARRTQDPNLISGRIVAHRDGYAFLVPDKPIPRVDGDLFIGRDALNDAMHGDHVLARVERRRADGRAEGRVVQVVERENPTIVGIFRYGPQGNHVLPYDTRILHEVSIPPGEELTPQLREKIGAGPGKDMPSSRLRLPELDGAVVNVELTRYPKGGLAPAGRVVEILGRPGEIGLDVEIIIRKHHLPHVFPDAALAEAHATPQQVAGADLRGRRDFRDLPIVTIDGETARDFDDGVYVASLPNGHYELQVHIADVAHYVERGSALDREARLRGTSVYFPNRAVPMLPEICRTEFAP